MKSIIITGATSMIGAALTEVAIGNGMEVYAIIRPDTKRMDRLVQSPLVHPIYAALESLSDIIDIPNNCDVFYHFAWAGTDKTHRDDPTIQESNIKYSLDAVDLAKRCGCKKFIGAGSQAEYGPVDGVIDDKTRFSPVTSYGAAKYTAGILSRKLCEQYGMIHIWGRIFSVYGPHDNEETILNYAIERFSKGKTAFFSACTQMWDYLYEKDAANIFFLMGEKIKTDSSMRVAGGHSLTLKKYIEKLAEEFNADDLCVFGSDAGTYGIITDASKTYKELGYDAIYSFEQGISETVDFYKKQKRKIDEGDTDV